MTSNRKKLLIKLLNLYTVVGVTLVFLGIFAIAFPVLPGLIYAIYPTAYVNELSSLTEEIHIDPADLPNEPSDLPTTEEFPPQDLTLPISPQLEIPSVGVDASLQSGADANSALNNGPWLVPDMGDPMDPGLPTIIASHRWGGIGWSAEQREKLSFKELPKLVSGDTIQIVWDQRIFEYQVIRVVESTYIDDYNPDLILYTCKYLWQNPTRIFVYAERIN